MPGLLTLTTNLKSLKYGQDRPDGGSSGQPYITTDINKIDSGANRLRFTKFDSGFVRGGVIGATAASSIDLARIGKFFIDAPYGPLFIAKQIGLQLSNPKLEAKQFRTDRTGRLGNILNIASRAFNAIGPTRTYNLGLNTLAEIPVAAFGTHFNRHGLLPVQNDEDKYEAVVQFNNKNGNNRLEGLYNKFELGKPIINKPVQQLVDQYLGGPSSVYGLGVTFINRYYHTDNIERENEAKQISHNYAGYSRVLDPGLTYDLTTGLGGKNSYTFGRSISTTLIEYNQKSFTEEIEIKNGIDQTVLIGSLFNEKQENLVTQITDQTTKGKEKTYGIFANISQPISSPRSQTISSSLFVFGNKSTDQDVKNAANQNAVKYSNPLLPTYTDVNSQVEAQQADIKAGNPVNFDRYTFSTQSYTINDALTANNSPIDLNNPNVKTAVVQNAVIANSSTFKTYQNIVAQTKKDNDDFQTYDHTPYAQTLPNGNIANLASNNRYYYNTNFKIKKSAGSGYSSYVNTNLSSKIDKTAQSQVNTYISDNTGANFLNYSDSIYSSRVNHAPPGTTLPGGKNKLSKIKPSDFKYYNGEKTIDVFNRYLDKDLDYSALPLVFTPINPFSLEETPTRFLAYLNNYNEDYQSNWADVKYVGRAEKFYVFSDFKKTATIDLTVPCFNQEDLITNHNKILALGNKGLAYALAGQYNDKNLLGGIITKVTVGKYLVETPSIINSLKLDIIEGSSWDLEELYAFYIKISLSLTIIGNQLPIYDNNRPVSTPPKPTPEEAPATSSQEPEVLRTVVSTKLNSDYLGPGRTFEQNENFYKLSQFPNNTVITPNRSDAFTSFIENQQYGQIGTGVRLGGGLINSPE